MKIDEKDNCYICLEKVKDPIYPAGCTHALCRKHLKVKQLLNLIILGYAKIRMWHMSFTF